MALKWWDAFDSYGATADLLKNWRSNTNTAWTWDATSGRLSGGCIKTTTTAGVLYAPRSTLSVTSGTNMSFSGWFKITATPSATLQFVSLASTGDAQNGCLGLATTGVLGLYNAGMSLLQASTSGNVCDGNWHWVDALFGVGSTSGAIWLDGVAVAGPITLNFGIAGTTIDSIYLSSAAQGNYIWDDIYVTDTNTPSPRVADFPIGPRQMNTLRAASDSAVQFAPNSGANNFSRINETAADDDTSYNQDNTSGHADEFNYGALGFTPTTINAVGVTTRVKNPGTTASVSWKTRCRSGATVSDSAANAALVSWSTIGDLNAKKAYEQDPNTSAAWTAANLASAKFGYTVA